MSAFKRFGFALLLALGALSAGSQTSTGIQGPGATGGGGGGSGSVTSVALTAPSIFSVTGSPVTTSGTLALAFATGQTANRVLASPNGSAGAISLRALVAGDIPSISLTSGVTGVLAGTNGGTGVNNGSNTITLAGNLATSGANSLTLTTTGATNVTLPTSGTLSTVALANPSGLIGMTAVNGSASTTDRSDATHAIDPAIAPTWTGVHTFSGSGKILNTNGTNSAPSYAFSGSIGTGMYSPGTDQIGFSAGGTTLFTANNGGSTFNLSIAVNDSLGYLLRNTGATTNEKIWQATYTGSSWKLATVTDAVGAGKNALLIARSGTAITSLSLGNATDNPSYAFLGTGTATFSGNVTAAKGVTADGGGLKHTRVTTGSVAGGSTALVTITWTTAFADANYTATCSVEDSTTSSLSLSVVHTESRTASALAVRVLNNAVGALTGTLACIAVHD